MKYLTLLYLLLAFYSIFCMIIGEITLSIKGEHKSISIKKEDDPTFFWVISSLGFIPITIHTIKYLLS